MEVNISYCIFCNKEINNKGSLKAHEISCHSNPERKSHHHSIRAGIQKGNVPWNKGKKIGKSEYYKQKYPFENIFIENSTYSRHCLKRRILEKELIDYVCDICKIGPIWNEQRMPLLLDHINGINNDNRLNNLRFICSNCDTQLPTYKSRNRKSKN